MASVHQKIVTTTESISSETQTLKPNHLKYLAIFSAINLHQLSEKLLPVYAIIVLVSFSILAIDLARSRLTFDRPTAFNLALVGLYVLVALGSYVHSLLIISTAGATVGLIRFLFAFPVFLASLIYIRSVDDLRLCLIGMAAIVAILYLSVPWQIAFGELWWLPSDYERGGFTRYASALGNVTAVGIALGFYLAPALFLARSARLRMILTASLLVSGAASLSKAAIMNAALVPILGAMQGIAHPAFRVWKNWKISDGMKVGGALLLCIGMAFSVPAVRDRLMVNLASYGIVNKSANDDVSLDKSIFERLAHYPGIVFKSLQDRYSEIGWMTGAGFGMSSTALVPEIDSLSTMAHNQLVDLIGIGGMPYLFLFICMLASIGFSIVNGAVSAYRDRYADAQATYATLIVMFLNFLTNLPFANGLIYQPLQASIFWLLVSISCNPFFGTRSRVGCTTQ